MSVNKELDVIKYDIDNIKNLIYTIRGQQVMLDGNNKRAFLNVHKKMYEIINIQKGRKLRPLNSSFG